MAKLVVKMVSDMIDEIKYETRKNGASPSSSTSTHGVSHRGLQKMWWGKCIVVLDELDGRLFIIERSKPIYTYPIESHRKR